jgi:peptidoglycan/LPS O-acetylase OafA/YrhL
MERRRLLGGIVAAAGVVVLVLFAFADQFGYGDEGFGWLQTLGVVIGAAAVVLGLGAMVWKRGRAHTPHPTG